MRFPIICGRVASLGLLSVLAAVGCSGEGAGDSNSGFPDLSARVPVGGVVTVQGKPLAEAVVTFLPNQGGTGVGETDEEGKYTLQSYGTPGMLPGEYKVAISYLVSAEGEPQGLGPRSAIVQSTGMLSAKELLPDEYSNLGRTKLTASVSRQKSTFAFDIVAPLLPGPERKNEQEKATESSPGGPKPKGEKSAGPPTAKEPDGKEDVQSSADPRKD